MKAGALQPTADSCDVTASMTRRLSLARSVNDANFTTVLYVTLFFKFLQYKKQKLGRTAEKKEARLIPAEDRQG